MYLKIMLWIARVLVIVSIIFMIMFSFDSFGGNEPFGKQILGFIMQNIPAFVLIISLIIAWKYEIAGGILFIAAFIVLGIFFKSFGQNHASLYIISPFLISGILFILHRMLMRGQTN